MQDESSMCAVAAAGIRPEDFVMDICAAPGGKTTAAAEFSTARACAVDGTLQRKTGID